MEKKKEEVQVFYLRFISRCFIFFCVITTGVNFLITFSDSLLLVYINATDFITLIICPSLGLQVVLVVKNPAANAGDMRHGFDPWVGKIHWRRAWQSTAVFLPGAPHGQRSLTS